ncbi:MAG: bifunctional phosphoribosylaminoimidazolecarboxamide formyltransferase/IMP cyclohydrolase [Peptoniphilaceae bacterium]|nr:bifunctional phosphoribosylaminoimidazolecarboxamide formyltransferase/IMP cyclohydrolase [Peptoniphilaceae bacterium]MDY3738632.1 bifunctional phosphoribosylaminoimidazolecarboxamide formyltransferase/IMP cyclohydrolase [Peptoniphilaceae bacterium]
MRALISVFDKNNIVDFAEKLSELGWEIVSTGGTYSKLKNEGIKVLSVEDITGFPEILDGRVKTLNPKIHAGILYKRDNEEHVNKMKELNLKSFDMIVCNLYPFEKTLQQTDDENKIIEMIDIGGPSMLRAAAKNFKDVIVVTDSSDYDEIIERLKNGNVDFGFKKNLAKKVFEKTYQYDNAIYNYFNSDNESDEFKNNLTFNFKKESDLRYGENPHQKAAFYLNENLDEKYKAHIKKLHGKEISYNNLVDLNAAVKYVKYFDKCATVAIKHRNPCGIAVGENPYESYIKAYECDDESIFGGIVAFNREVDEKVAKEMSKIFLEIIAAPSFTKEAFDILSKKKNIRLIEIDNLNEMENPKYQVNEVLNGIVIQEHDNSFMNDELDFVTNRKPTEKEIEDLKFAFLCVKAAASNGIVVAKDGATLGIGQGQTKRSRAVEEALERAGEKVEGSVVASDAFFFKDTVELMKKYNVKAVIQPGGSIHDKEVIDYANENDISVVFTHIRHFRHS